MLRKLVHRDAANPYSQNEPAHGDFTLIVIMNILSHLVTDDFDIQYLQFLVNDCGMLRNVTYLHEVISAERAFTYS